MPEVSVNHKFSGNIENVFDGIRQYDKYPEYLPGVTKIEVLPASEQGSSCRVRYDLKLVKNFFYILHMFEEKPNKIHWNLDESNIMKTSSGSWQLSEQDGETQAIYTVDIAFRGLVPQKIVDQITKANLPLMMSGFQKMIDDQSS